MTFGLAKCGCLIVNRGKVKSTCGISLPEGQIDDIDESYKYLGILQSFSNNNEEVRCKATSEYRNRVRRVLRSKLPSKNKVTAINTFAVPVIRYPAAVVTWRREDLKETDIGLQALFFVVHNIFNAVQTSSSFLLVYSLAVLDLGWNTPCIVMSFLVPCRFLSDLLVSR